jgi:hypothetical protein
MRNLLVVPILLAGVAMFSSCGGGQGGGAGGGAKGNGKTIAVIPKGTTHEFWLSVKAGAERAGKELKVNIDWVGPEKEDDRGQEIGRQRDRAGPSGPQGPDGSGHQSPGRQGARRDHRLGPGRQ